MVGENIYSRYEVENRSSKEKQKRAKFLFKLRKNNKNA